MEKYLTVKQAADILNVSPETLRRWDNSGKFKSLRHLINNYRAYSEEQLQNFAGNMLQVKNTIGEQFFVFCQTAYNSLNEKQISSIEKYNSIIYSDLNTIEVSGGGSARCMLAEVFLPKE